MRTSQAILMTRDDIIKSARKATSCVFTSHVGDEKTHIRSQAQLFKVCLHTTTRAVVVVVWAHFQP